MSAYEGKPYMTMLKLTGCNPEEGEFTCDNGQCIPGHLQCSGKPECNDESDEKQCRKYFFIINFVDKLLDLYNCNTLVFKASKCYL